MPIYGVRIQKEQGGVPFENRYFTSADDMDTAQAIASAWVTFEKAIHGIQVAFTKVNIWEIGATPRRHRSVPLSGFGVIAGSAPTALEMTLKITFGAEDSYPYYKEYRVAVNSDNTNTRIWNSPYLAVVLDAVEAADESEAWDRNRTKTGAPLADPVIQTAVEFSQLHKRWYNRSS